MHGKRRSAEAGEFTHLCQNRGSTSVCTLRLVFIGAKVKIYRDINQARLQHHVLTSSMGGQNQMRPTSVDLSKDHLPNAVIATGQAVECLAKGDSTPRSRTRRHRLLRPMREKESQSCLPFIRMLHQLAAKVGCTGPGGLPPSARCLYSYARTAEPAEPMSLEKSVPEARAGFVISVFRADMISCIF